VAVAAPYLVDKSALARMPHPRVAAVLERLFAEGRVATCGIVDLEVLFSARNRKELANVRQERAALVQVSMLQVDFERAMDVMEMLAARGEHRAATIPDLLIAAAAERAGLCILHYGQDFERIAAVTEQRAQWVVPRASI
jgi:predicted nucleic acid-binding protein